MDHHALHELIAQVTRELKVTPNYTGKLWLGAAAYAEQAFIGRSNARGLASLDWNALTPGSSHDVALAKTGAGRMYYRVGISYAPRDTNLAPLDAGFIVRRPFPSAMWPPVTSSRPSGRKEWPEQKTSVRVLSISRDVPVTGFQM